MKQFILNKEPGKDGIVRLEGGDFRYLVRVRRLAVGEFFPALLPNGEETSVRILSIERGVLTGKCDFPQTAETEPADAQGKKEQPRIVLFQALPKGDKMDLIVRQAAEGGIAEVVPFRSEFSVAKVGAGAGEQKFSRWERIVKEARQQSGSKTATAIRRPKTGGIFAINGLFEYWGELRREGAAGILFHHMGIANKSLHGYLDSSPCVVVLAIGPEGGFSDAEVSLFLENGFKPLTIGNSVLRTETAALYCAAAVKIILLERDSWELNKEESENELIC